MVDSHKVVERELKFLITFCSSGKLYLACTTMKAILTSPNFFMNGIDYSSSESEFPRKLYLPARQVKNEVTTRLNNKIQYPRVVAWTLLCLLSLHAV